MKSDAEKLKQRQTVKKYLVFALMFLVFAACMWFIFAPSESDRAADEQQKGFNTELPDPRNAGIVDDKMTAYEQESMRQKREEKMRTLEDMVTPDTGSHSASTSGNATSLDIPSDVVIVDDETGRPVAGGSRSGPSYSSSQNAYRSINETLGSFYEQPETDPEKDAMREELEQLRQSVAQQQPPAYRMPSRSHFWKSHTSWRRGICRMEKISGPDMIPMKRRATMARRRPCRSAGSRRPWCRRSRSLSATP